MNEQFTQATAQQMVDLLRANGQSDCAVIADPVTGEWGVRLAGAKTGHVLEMATLMGWDCASCGGFHWTAADEDNCSWNRGHRTCQDPQAEQEATWKEEERVFEASR